MITREQVADLQPGDVVELRHDRWPEDTVIRGPLYAVDGRLECGPAVVVWSGGEPQSAYDLTVVSRAPRPLYVNHPRTEPVTGDIVNFPSGYGEGVVGPYLYGYTEQWAGTADAGRKTRWVGLPGCHPDTGPIYNAGKLRLLVDGETGQVVQ